VTAAASSGLKVIYFSNNEVVNEIKNIYPAATFMPARRMGCFIPKSFVRGVLIVGEDICGQIRAAEN
jgi:hypothetical protein